jgi:hypothetical protein
MVLACRLLKSVRLRTSSNFAKVLILSNTQRSDKVKRRREKRARRGGRGKKEREAKAALFHHDLNGRALRVALVQATLETH